MTIELDEALAPTRFPNEGKDKGNGLGGLILQEGHPSKQLSVRESEIIYMAAEGYTDKEICARLGLSNATVRSYWMRIRLKCNAVNRCQAVAQWCACQPNGKA